MKCSRNKLEYIYQSIELMLVSQMESEYSWVDRQLISNLPFALNAIFKLTTLIPRTGTSNTRLIFNCHKSLVGCLASKVNWPSVSLLSPAYNVFLFQSTLFLIHFLHNPLQSTHWSFFLMFKMFWIYPIIDFSWAFLVYNFLV